MKKISAEIIADSEDSRGNRITTMVLTFPRFILAELNTHRMFSRNSASSRAIPFKTMVKMIEEDPFIPIAWQKDHKGMQGSEYITTGGEIQLREVQWSNARVHAIHSAKLLNNDCTYSYKEGDIENSGVTKQLCNRLLEPFMWHTVIVTATEFENFFKLRCPQYEHADDNIYRSRTDWIKALGPYNKKCKKETGIMCTPYIPNTPEKWLKWNKGQSEIHMMELAECMWDAMNESKPWKLNPGEWHIPFGDSFDEDKLMKLRMKVYDDIKRDTQQLHRHLNELKSKVATARCARVSYLNYEGKDDYEADIKLYDRLLESGHMSPFEHVAMCMDDKVYMSNIKGCLYPIEIRFDHVMYTKVYKSDKEAGWCRNFKGFIQLRETIEYGK